MRSLLRTAGVTGAGLLVACSAVLGVDDFEVKPATSGVDANAGDSGGADGNVLGNDGGGGDSGLDADKGDTGLVDSGSDTGPTAECKVSKDCEVKGENFICRKSDFKCVSLVTPECTHVLGTYKDDNALILGSIAPTAGPDQTSGLPEQNAIDLAIGEFNNNGGVPAPTGSGGTSRPLVLVGCNDNSDADQAVVAARHLVDDLRVPAIIGAAFSGITLKVATQVTINSGTFLISPSATSVSLTALSDNGLVWRTIASDNIQADADAAFYGQLEKKVRDTKGDDTYTLKVAIANKGDAYGTGLASALSSKLTLNGAPFLDAANIDNRLVTDFGDPDGATPPTYDKSIVDIVAFKPDVVYLFGTTEVVTEILKGVEENPSSPKPYYILADGGLVGELKTYLETMRATKPVDAEDLRHRILGTVPGTTSSVFTLFTQRYRSKYNDGLETTSGVANAYDALYNVAYAIAASKATKITGAAIRDGMSSLVSGATKVDTGATNITAAFNTLSTGSKIDYNGASGPLDYDLLTGEAPSDIQIWCLPKNTTTGVISGGTGTTVIYDATTKALKGDFNTLTNDCKW